MALVGKVRRAVVVNVLLVMRGKNRDASAMRDKDCAHGHVGLNKNSDNAESSSMAFATSHTSLVLQLAILAIPILILLSAFCFVAANVSCHVFAAIKKDRHHR